DHTPRHVAEMRIPPPAAGLEAPLEHRARDVQRSRDDARAAAIGVRADVDEERSVGRRRERLCGVEARDPLARLAKELVERPRRVVHGGESTIAPCAPARTGSSACRRSTSPPCFAGSPTPAWTSSTSDEATRRS